MNAACQRDQTLLYQHNCGHRIVAPPHVTNDSCTEILGVCCSTNKQTIHTQALIHRRGHNKAPTHGTNHSRENTCIVHQGTPKRQTTHKHAICHCGRNAADQCQHARTLASCIKGRKRGRQHTSTPFVTVDATLRTSAKTRELHPGPAELAARARAILP